MTDILQINKSTTIKFNNKIVTVRKSKNSDYKQKKPNINNSIESHKNLKKLL